ncbi:MAG: O-methyltransferase [Planctomycetia bacterium]|nr:O-methyltransferase [Planctomycetia bacterium]
MPITDPTVDAYVYAHAPARDAVFLEMEAYARTRGFPIVGPAVGSLLEVLARSIGARRVYELGSGFGYSAAWWLRGMPADGQVTLTDLDPDNVARGLAYLDRLGDRDRVRYVREDALSAFRRETGPFDVVYCDIDKEGYPDVVEPAVARLRPGGLLVTDNVLWDGAVADRTAQDPATVAIRRYVEAVTTHPRLRTTILPLRDGVAVSVRLP